MSPLNQEIRTICYDEDLKIEAYRFEGFLHPFPNHFHEHYMVGFIREGQRIMTCRNTDYHLYADDIVLLHPQQNHTCMPYENSPLCFWGLNIPSVVMETLTQEITGSAFLPVFASPVHRHPGISGMIGRLNEMIFQSSREFEKEELLLALTSLLLEVCAENGFVPESENDGDISSVCRCIEDHFAEHISLDQLCREAAMSKSTLLRTFTRTMGITPYRYLETVRVNHARKLLAQGVSPAEAAAASGFTDQSHFSRYFTSFTGVTPGMYQKIFQRREEEK